MSRAKTLEEASKLLDPRPLNFAQPSSASAVEAAADPAFYAPPPQRMDGKFKLPGPMENIRQRLLSGTRDTKMFLSGHVGSGKSTELNRLAVDNEIRQRFSVTMLRFEEQEWATLDSSQVLFRLAGALFNQHKAVLSKESRWAKLLDTLSDRIFQETGIRAKEGSLGLEFNLLVVKLRQELKLSEKVRKGFRNFGETQQSLLQDFLEALVNDAEDRLGAYENPSELLVLVDDLDKVRGVEAQKEIFDVSLNALLAPPMRVVYTLPTGVSFGEKRADIRHNVEHLYPVRVLKKAPGIYNAEDAYFGDRAGFFDTLVRVRVEEGLIEPEAIKLASIYSGGVLREFFRLLREGIRIALYNGLEVLDDVAMKYALNEARLKESVGLYSPDYEALLHVHRTNDLRSSDDRRYLDLSRILECFNAASWFEANPLLWQLLERHAADGDRA